MPGMVMSLGALVLSMVAFVLVEWENRNEYLSFNWPLAVLWCQAIRNLKRRRHNRGRVGIIIKKDPKKRVCQASKW
jgi:hypothetical protein